MLKNVVAAYIEINDKFLIAKRADGKFKGLWEFPGGKVESGESDEVALEREIKEELNLNVKPWSLIGSNVYRYGDNGILLKLYDCNYLGGDLTLNAHTDYKFITKEEINDYEWCPADYDLLTYIRVNEDTNKEVKENTKKRVLKK